MLSTIVKMYGRIVIITIFNDCAMLLLVGSQNIMFWICWRWSLSKNNKKNLCFQWTLCFKCNQPTFQEAFKRHLLVCWSEYQAEMATHTILILMQLQQFLLLPTTTALVGHSVFFNIFFGIRPTWAPTDSLIAY